MTITELLDRSGISRNELKKLLVEKQIPPQGSSVTDDIASQIISEKETYIGLQEYAKIHTSDRFNGCRSQDREKLYDYIENSHCFHLEAKRFEELLIGNPLDKLYFLRKDVPVLDKKLEAFFNFFGASEEEKITHLLEHHDGVTADLLRKFFAENVYVEKMTPSLTAFVQNIVDCPNIQALESEDLSKLLKRAGTESEKTFLVRFLNYARTELDVSYNELHRKYKESKVVPAYSYDTYITLAKMIFDPEFIYHQKLIEKSLENGLDAEMWLYISLFYCCGWRAGDICREWRYPNLTQYPERCEYLGITLDTLKEDILADRIPEKPLREICMYSMGAIDAFGPGPHKTLSHNPGPLQVVITESLYTFIGLLTLIGECCYLATGKFGHMSEKRAPIYQNLVRLKGFFGEEIETVLDGFNLQTRRLNKSYLQGLEEKARQLGLGGVLSSTIASMARGHIDLGTIRIYLRDHNLTAEDASTVLYMMMERGVLGFEVYHAVLTSYPEAINGLTMKQQNELLAQLNVSPLELEIAASETLAQETMRTSLLVGNKQSAVSILTSLFAICQGEGRGKDEGTYCFRRARGERCNHGGWKSCIGNGCTDSILTRMGVLPMLKTLKRFYDAANDGDRKAKSVLTQILLPRYKEIILEMMRSVNMSSDDRSGLRTLMLEVLNG